MSSSSRTEEFGAVSRGQTFTYEPEKLVLITDKSHPLYDERVNLPVPEALVLSIMAYGVIKPIVCRKNGTHTDGSAIIEVVDGRQRTRATVEANRRLVAAGQRPLLISAVMRRAGEQDAIGCMITTNEVVVVDDVVTKAAKLARFLMHGHSRQEAQIVFGLKPRGIDELEAIANLSPKAQEQLRAREISYSCALELAKLPSTEQASMLQTAADEPKENSITPKDKSKRLTAAAVKRASGRAKTTKSKHKSRPAKILVKMIKNVEAGNVRGSASFKQGVLVALKWAIGGDSVSLGEIEES